MSFVARSRARPRRGVAIAAIDEDEAEIVEFYEREEMMERGTPPAKGRRDDNEDDNEDTWRRLLGGTKRQGDGDDGFRGDDPSGPSSAESPCENSHRRSASDSSLLGHPHHHPAGENTRRHSKCDLYYSRVLGQLLNYEDEDVGDAVRPLTDQGEDEGDGDDAPCHDVRDCQISVLENFSSLTSEEEFEGANELEHDRADPTATADDTPPDPRQYAISAGVSLFERTPTAGEGQGQVQEPGQEQACYRPPSPLSSSSSISSLSSEGFDIEAPSAKLLCASITPVSPGGEEQVSRRPTPTAAAADAEYDVASPTNNTPTRSNLHHDQSRCTLRGEKNLSSRRRVSFSPEVEVCNITPGHAATTGQKRVHELSFEGYLYIMLLAVAVAIAVFSLVPAHPSLSPVHSRGDIFRLTENLLNSQWDVEL
ncbi:hypothetical protein ACHAW5_005187 [Stephanodiscus triporus]|uniref:Uncharacterized protein n=1 Tax=Stephanodiscus triporus TaxID=2934178 RepID=A0ABD3P6R7_9STRA